MASCGASPRAAAGCVALREPRVARAREEVLGGVGDAVRVSVWRMLIVMLLRVAMPLGVRHRWRADRSHHVEFIGAGPLQRTHVYALASVAGVRGDQSRPALVELVVIVAVLRSGRFPRATSSPRTVSP